MLLQLIAALALCGAVTSDHTNEPPGLNHEMGFEWEEVIHSEFYTHLRSDWRESGLQFKVSTNETDFRELMFYSDDLWYGSINWDATEFSIYGYNTPNTPRGVQAPKQSCNVNGRELTGTGNYIDYKIGNQSNTVGVWTLRIQGDMLKLWLNDKMMISLDVSGCASWLKDEEIGVLKMMDFEVEFEGKASDEYRYAKRIPHAEDCQRGEFWWREECHQCPPGKSTVREGDTDYNDCIDMRYISCRPHEDMVMMECERDICPCNAYEECNRDYNSAEYGICMMQSDYRNGGVSVTVSTGLLVLVTFLFNFME